MARDRARLRVFVVAAGLVAPLVIAGAAVADPVPYRYQPPAAPRFASGTGSSGVAWDSVAFAAAGAFAGIIGANYFTGGLLTPVLTFGAVAPPPSAAATLASPTALIVFVAAEAAGIAADFVIAAAAPTAAVSVGAPVDAALRDGYTTPTDLLYAFGESARRAGTVAVAVGDYVGSTVGRWIDWPY